MERDCTMRVTRMAFLSGFFLGGISTYAQAKETFERSNVGRKYLSPSDAVKRRMDYAILRFAKSGFSMGFKCAFISGSIVLLSTHLAAYRQRFSSWYFPALSALVGGVFTFPLGVIGSIKAVSLGVTSGLTLSAVVYLYALSVDKSVDEAYWIFKREYEKVNIMYRHYLCNLQYDAGKFGDKGSHTPRYFYSKSLKNCMLFTFYGRDGNANNFETYNECKKMCMT
ncbi:Kunitz/Bovine pancreatic trypsin inhibitor domain protein [Cooperia oncophora]